MRSSLFCLGAAVFAATSVVGQSTQAKCSLTNKCPESAPCCSQYGDCGVGAYCLGGCDPRMSFSLESCVPAPVCQDRTMKMDSTDRIVDVSKYLGDASKADWMSQGEAVTRNGNLLLTMPKNSVGTVLASTAYLWYGSVKAKIKSSRGAGVITGFILLSDVKDEIDYEWVGADLETVQTNYYFQGVTDYTQSKNLTLTDTFANWHEYEVQWTPDKITWLVNGQVGRVKERKDTWNAKTQQWLFPQTPARVQLSIWPGGLPTNPQGTIDWAGGVIDWDNAEDIKKAGYYYASFSDIEIKCWDGKRGEPGSNSGTSYTYDSIVGTNDTVVDGDKKTILASLQGTGTDMDKGKPANSGSNTESASASATGESQQSIPGGGTNPGGQVPGSSDSSGSSDNTNTVPGGDTSSSGNSDCNARDFTQNEDSCGTSSSGTNAQDSPGAGSRTTAGASAFAALVAMAALFWI